MVEQRRSKIDGMEEPMLSASVSPNRPPATGKPAAILRCIGLAVTLLAMLMPVVGFLLVQRADLLQAGSLAGVLAFSWLGLLLAGRSRRNPDLVGRSALMGTSLAGYMLIVEPSLPALLLFCAGIGVVVSLHRCSALLRRDPRPYIRALTPSP